MSEDVFRPVVDFFVDPAASPAVRKARSRWCADQCRSGRIPGALRVGREWLIRPRDVEAFVQGRASAGAPTVEDAERDLRSRGVLL